MVDWSQELLLVDKPLGITSFDVIRRLRRLYSETHDGARAPKLGHAGTLDPLATGLMLIGVGSGTKRLGELTKLDKVYEATVCIGESRTTGDQEGEVTAAVDISEYNEADTVAIKQAVAQLVGQQVLPVSAYSAIKVDGVPMYKRARQAEVTGEEIIDIPVRTMTVYEAAVSAITLRQNRLYVDVTFHVASGTYIRSLAEALGRSLGYPACLQSLRRTRVGEYQVEAALQLPTKTL